MKPTTASRFMTSLSYHTITVNMSSENTCQDGMLIKFGPSIYSTKHTLKCRRYKLKYSQMQSTTHQLLNGPTVFSQYQNHKPIKALTSAKAIMLNHTSHKSSMISKMNGHM